MGHLGNVLPKQSLGKYWKTKANTIKSRNKKWPKITSKNTKMKPKDNH